MDQLDSTILAIFSDQIKIVHPNSGFRLLNIWNLRHASVTPVTQTGISLAIFKKSGSYYGDF